MKELGLLALQIADKPDVLPNRISPIAKESRAVTPDTALRLARLFGTTPEFWLIMQAAQDLSKAIVESSKEIKRSVKPLKVMG